MKQTDIAWAAGYFDGEGSVSIPLKSQKWPYLQVAISCKDARPLRRIQNLFAGAVTKDNRSGGCFRWQVQSREAIAFMKLIRPYLSCKDKAVAVGLSFEEVMRPRGTRRLPDGFLARRLELRAEVMRINRED
jgi:hypothetical protein